MLNTAALAQTTYYLEAPFAPWLWPLLAVSGIALQIVAAFLRRPVMLAAGLGLTVAGCAPDRDLTLMTGDILASLGLWYCLKKL